MPAAGFREVLLAGLNAWREIVTVARAANTAAILSVVVTFISFEWSYPCSYDLKFATRCAEALIDIFWPGIEIFDGQWGQVFWGYLSVSARIAAQMRRGIVGATYKKAPLSLAVVIWFLCRRSVQGWWVGLSFLLGAIACFPIARLGSWLTDHSQGLVAHFYLEEFFEQLISTAVPEEVGKSLAALLVLKLARFPGSAAAWVAIGAAAHCGFAAVEGLFSALGNEGFWKVMVGRVLGALSHCSWGVMGLFFVWRGWRAKEERFVNWTIAVLVPAILHAVMNAALVEVPKGASEAVEGVLVLSSLAGLVVSVVGAAVAVWAIQFRREPVLRTEG